MDFPDWLKSQVTVPNFLYVMVVLSLTLYVLKKFRGAAAVLLSAFIFFLLTSTSFLPHYLVRKLERKVTPLTIVPDSVRQNKVLIHVLGGGYSLTPLLPANVQLGLPTLGRLVEGIRILRMLPKATLVTSGYSAIGLKSQASVMRQAAIDLGVDSARIEMLETPTNTWEEAVALKEKFGTDHAVILVSDAIHLPRAKAFFEEQGFRVLVAPSSFLIVPGNVNQKVRWFPSIRNIEMSNILLREYLGTAKGYILN